MRRFDINSIFNSLSSHVVRGPRPACLTPVGLLSIGGEAVHKPRGHMYDFLGAPSFDTSVFTTSNGQTPHAARVEVHALSPVIRFCPCFRLMVDFDE